MEGFLKSFSTAAERVLLIALILLGIALHVFTHRALSHDFRAPALITFPHAVQPADRAPEVGRAPTECRF